MLIGYDVVAIRWVPFANVLFYLKWTPLLKYCIYLLKVIVYADGKLFSLKIV